MKEVSMDKFWLTVGLLNVHSSIEGEYPYTAVFKFPDGREVGRIVPASIEEYPIEYRYYIKEQK